LSTTYVDEVCERTSVGSQRVNTVRSAETVRIRGVVNVSLLENLEPKDIEP